MIAVRKEALAEGIEKDGEGAVIGLMVGKRQRELREADAHEAAMANKW